MIAEDDKLIDEIVRRYGGEPGMLIPMMQDLQAARGYLPAGPLRQLARRLDVPFSRLYAVATFYASFRTEPRGRHEVTLCVGTVCFLKGSDRIAEMICREFDVAPGHTTSDGAFSYQPVNCVGACALAPVMVVDGEYHDAMTPEKARSLLRALDAPAEAPGEEAAP